jgi:Domain of unknown function (DUF397)
MTNNEISRWRKSSFSGGENNECVEVAAGLGAVRDSKNPTGSNLHADLHALLGAIRDDRLAR